MVQVIIEGPLMPRWRVDIIAAEMQNLGTVDAPNAWEALASLRSKTVVTKLEEPEPSSLR
jgi:hypothetical protein